MKRYSAPLQSHGTEGEESNAEDLEMILEGVFPLNTTDARLKELPLDTISKDD